MDPIRILGVDPGLRHTGWGIISISGARMGWVAHGVIRPEVKAAMSERLAAIFAGLQTVISDYSPDCAGIEETFVNQNPKSTLLLGQARGAAMTSLAVSDLRVDEFAARKIKQCVVGAGNADKTQIEFMVRRLLPKAEKMSSDAADALAVAITTAHHFTPTNGAQNRAKHA